MCKIKLCLFSVTRAIGRRRRAYIEIEKINRHIEAILRFTPIDDEIGGQLDRALERHGRVRRKVNDDIRQLLGRILDRDVYEKELQLLLERLKEVAVEAEAVKTSNAIHTVRKQNYPEDSEDSEDSEGSEYLGYLEDSEDEHFEIPVSTGNDIVTILSLVTRRCTLKM